MTCCEKIPCFTMFEYAVELRTDLWKFYGIDKDFLDTSQPPNYPSGSCKCNRAYDDFLASISCACSLFEDLAIWSNIPKAFMETVPFPYPERGLYDTWGDGKRIKLENLPVIEFGKRILTLHLKDVTLTRLNGGGLLDTFSAIISVPDDTALDDVHVFFTPEDVGYDPDCINWDYEIRPLAMSYVNQTAGNWQIEISGHNPLFLLPNIRQTEPYSNFPCLPYVEEVFAEQVDIYLANLDICQQGQIAGKSTRCTCTDGCNTVDCPVCFTLEDCRYAQYRFFQCNENEELVCYDPCSCIQGRPVHVVVNYLAGECWEERLVQGLNYRRVMNREDRLTLFNLAIHCGECIEYYCECGQCGDRRILNLRDVQFVRDNPSSNPDDDYGQFIDWISVNPYDLNYLPTLALVKATTAIRLKNKRILRNCYGT